MSVWSWRNIVFLSKFQMLSIHEHLCMEIFTKYIVCMVTMEIGPNMNNTIQISIRFIKCVKSYLIQFFHTFDNGWYLLWSNFYISILMEQITITNNTFYKHFHSKYSIPQQLRIWPDRVIRVDPIGFRVNFGSTRNGPIGFGSTRNENGLTRPVPSPF
jgi:hypothetical protein